MPAEDIGQHPSGIASSGSSSPRITIRPARLTDQFAIARLNTRAFFEDVLFGQTIHPHRRRYPNDSNHYWLSRNLVAWSDWSHLFTVAVLRDGTQQQQQHQRERIVGQAHWSRMGLNGDENRRAGWGLRWWDPRALLKPIVAGLVSLAKLFWKNRAADPELEGMVEGSYGYIDHVWDAAKGRCPSLYLESMAIDPDFQGRGIGKTLVQSGLKIAEDAGISASVISADGKEGFYRKCGFDVGPVGRSGEGAGNPLWAVPGGLVFFRQAPDMQLSEHDKDIEMEKALEGLRQDNEQGWPSVWLKNQSPE